MTLTKDQIGRKYEETLAQIASTFSRLSPEQYDDFKNQNRLSDPMSCYSCLAPIREPIQVKLQDNKSTSNYNFHENCLDELVSAMRSCNLEMN